MPCNQIQPMFFRSKLGSFFLLLTISLSLYCVAQAQSDPTPTVTPEHVADPGKVQRAMEFLKRGNDYAQKGLEDKAREMWGIALRLDPDSSEIREKLNPSSYSADSNSTEENKNLQETDPAKIERANEFLSRAQEAYDRKNYDEAEKYMVMAEALNPHDPKVKMIKSEIVLENFESDPDRPFNDLVKSYFKEAVDHFRKKEFEEALQSIGQAQKLDPKQTQVQKLKGLIEEEYSSILYGKEIERAKNELEVGDDVIAKEIIANVLAKDPAFQEAVDLQKQMDQAEERKDGEKDQTHFKKAKSEQGKSQIQDKIKDLENAVANGEKEKAAACLKQIENMDPNFPKLEYWKEKINELSGNEASESSEAKADEAYNMGLESYRKGDLAGAKEFWKEALDWDPRYEQAKRNLDRLFEEHPDLK